MSRRLYALALVLVCSLQSTGAASASTLSAPNTRPLFAALQSTWIFAALTGQSQLYADMHIAAPTLLKRQDAGVRPAMGRPVAAVTARTGAAVVLDANMPHAPYTKTFQADPLVIGAKAGASSARRSAPSSIRAVARPRALRASTGSTLHTMATFSAATPATTGVNPWWTYEEGAIPGVGKYMVNAGNGNLIVQSDDIDVPERGIDLAFRRSYNSQSTHDASNTDGTSASVFGNGWTNTFDEHLAYDPTTLTMSVYDLDGARYDYTGNASTCTLQTPSACWTPPAGMQGTTLQYNGNCAYWWTKKNGTSYLLYSPVTTCDTWLTNNPGFAGRPAAIQGRNSSNTVSFTYTWQTGGATSFENVASIVVQHSDGQSLTLNFSLFWANTELQKITRPDGQVITYSYDANGDLLTVTRPGNATDDATRTATITSLTDQYWYYANSHEMAWVAGPRYVWSNDADGSTDEFTYSANTTSGQLTWISDYGLSNFTPNDGVGAPLQAGSTAPNTLWRQKEFVYNEGSGNVTGMRDTEGHASQWLFDTLSRATKTWDWQGSEYLVTYATWDTHNNLTSSTDPRGNFTNYGYDINGNTIAVALPQVQTSAGLLNPTSTYTYDSNNNLLAYCDANYNGASNSWGNPALAPPVCPTNTAGTTRYTWTPIGGEPFGVLTDTYTPLGYHHHITYDSTGYGLPVQVQGDSMTQNDGTTRQPTQTFGYDSTGYGNLTSYNKGNGAWTLTYDTMHRVTQRTDPDNVSSYTCYNPDGSVSLTRTASQFAADGSVACGSINPATSAGVSMTYDADGNTLAEQHHHGCTALSGCAAGVTKKWYDGDDRLVEVEQPQDGNDAYAFPWYTRYIYDISNAAPQSITGGAQSFQAYGNLYKTQECIQGTSVQLSGGAVGTTSSTSQPVNTPSAPTVTGACTFQDLRGNTFDGVDRAPTKYEVAAGTAPEQTSVYDATGQAGLLSEKTNPLNQTDTLSYDNSGRLTSETFSDGITPNRSYAYDPDGHEVSLTSATLGTQTKTYDADGRLTESTDPSSEQDPGTTTYVYYADGMRKSLSLSVPAIGFNQNNLYTYNYRPDGERSSLVTAMGAGTTGTFAWTYTNAGRELTQTDPATGAVTNGQEPTGPSEPSYTLVAKSFSYDAYGRVSSLTLPRGAADGTDSGYYHDLEDGTVGSAWGSYQTSTRNEVSGFGFKGAQYANGAVCSVPLAQCNFDSRSGQMLSQQGTWSSGGSNEVALHQYAYDLAGRQTTDNLTCGSTSPMTATRSYDSDNHIAQQAMPAQFNPSLPSGAVATCSNGNANQAALSYTWGADGKLANFVTTQWVNVPTPTEETQTSAAHWDGDDLLYVSNTSVGMQLYIEKFGVMLWGTQYATWPLSVYDRDQTGTAINTHFLGTTTAPSIAGFTALSLDNVHPYMGGTGQCDTGVQAVNQMSKCSGDSSLAQAPTAGGPSSGVYASFSPLLSATRQDGYFDGTLSLQGVRAYDPNMNQWTSPDAYSGDVHDPMSQHPYMWNGNNPVQYSDPSGYETIELFDNHFGGPIPVGHAAIFITHGKGDNGTLYCLCGSSSKNPASGPAHILIQNTNLRSLTRGVGQNHGGTGARYDTGIIFNTTPSEETKIASMFQNDRGHSNYNVATHNCVQECSGALHAAGQALQGNSPIPNAQEGGGGESLHDIFESMLNNTAPPAQ